MTGLILCAVVTAILLAGCITCAVLVVQHDRRLRELEAQNRHPSSRMIITGDVPTANDVAKVLNNVTRRTEGRP